MKRWHGLVALGVGAIIVGGGGASANAVTPTSGAHASRIAASAQGLTARLADVVGLDEQPVAPGMLDDGKELLPRAAISLDDAVKAAQAAASGDVGEVDLEHAHGTLVFNVDIGNHDVKIDASTGDVLSVDQDD